MDLQKLMPSLGADGLLKLLKDGRWQVDHGTIERFPEFLRPGKGALSTIAKLAQWPRFDVAYRDDAGQYHQLKGSGISAVEYYEKGALVNSRSIEEVSDSARAWLGEWAQALGVPRDDLRLNSWAVKGTNGIDWHYDAEDVIHFQIAGKKLFKLLRTPKTRYADGQTKKFERILVARENFDDSSDQIVDAGSITIIPRGVWHWSECQSEESFAVSLCISSASFAQTLTQALYKRLRLLERDRMPLVGSPESQRQAMDACLKDAVEVLKTMSAYSVLSQEYLSVLPADGLASAYFYLSRRAHARLEPTRMWVDGKELMIPDDEKRGEVVKAICKVSDGFSIRTVRELVPHADASAIREVLASLVRAGFLDYVDCGVEHVD